MKEVVHDHILQKGALLRALSNAVKAWLIVYHECVAVGILCVAHSVEILEIQAIAKFKSGRPHQHTTHTQNTKTSIILRACFRCF
jgi:hypothetical protein